MEVLLDSELFVSRINRFFEVWRAGFSQPSSSWYNVDAVVFLSGRQDDGRPTPKTDQFHLWLFEYVFPETLLVALRNGQLFIVSGPKKLAVLRQLQHKKNITFLDKSNEDGNKSNVVKVFDAIKKQQENGSSARLITLGRLCGKNEETLGSFAEQIQTSISEVAPANLFTEAAVDDAIALLLAVQDKKALVCTAKASRLAVRLAQDVLIARVEDILDNETKETHADIANAAEAALDDPKKQERWKAKYQLEPDCLDLVFVNVQSGSKCDLRASALPSPKPLYIGPGTILLSLGTKYQDYTATLARTLLFNTTKEKRAVYQFALETLEYGIKLLTPGALFKIVHDTLREFVEKKRPSLLPYLTRTLGHNLGLEYREPSLMLSAKSNNVLTEGMVLNLTVGFANIPSKDGPHGSAYSIWLADTIQVCATGQAPKVLTNDLDKRLKAVNYELSDETDTQAEATKNNSKVDTKKALDAAGHRETGETASRKTNGVPSARVAGSNVKVAKSGRSEADALSPRLSKRSKSDEPCRDENDESRGLHSRSHQSRPESVILRDRLRSRGRTSNIEEVEKLVQRQRELRKQKTEEIRERFKDGPGQNLSTHKRSVKKMLSLTAYRDPVEYPKDLKPGRIYLDVASESVLVPIPISGHVPFHVSTIRNVFCQAEDKKFYTVRIQLQVPGTTGFGYKAEENPFPEVSGPDGMFVKELIYRSSNPNLPQLCKSLKELQKRSKQEENGDTSQTLAVQQPLQLNRREGKRAFLKNVMIKTGTNSRRTPGTLEAHVNGLRFSGNRVETVDINYSNVKHGFFQPCENELVVLIHFHLKNPILVNNKRTVDIQFYTEIGNQMDDLDQRRGRSTYDPDEIAQEQRERELKRRFNIEFKRFAETTEELARANHERLEFELPYRDLGFYGVPKNANQLILPTAHCLVQLAEWPVFVLTLSEIEIVSFERVYHGLRQFDIVFVFTDYSRPVRQITTVPISSLDTIKRWLNEMDIVWYESKGNLNWGEILKTIREDTAGFAEDGGFDIFLGDDHPSGRKRGKKNDRDGNGADEDDDEEDDDEDDEDDSSASFDSASSEDASDEDASSESTDDEDDSEEVSLASEDESSGSAASTLDSEEEEGLTWEELEQQAIRDDRKRARSGQIAMESEDVDRKKRLGSKNRV